MPNNREALRAIFPSVPRSVLKDLKRRYRRVWRERYCQWGFRLSWQCAGTVWAMDFSQPSQPIDGVFGNLFAVPIARAAVQPLME